MDNIEGTQSAFQQLKVSCVPLLANSLLTAKTISMTIELLSQLYETLVHLQSSGHVLAPPTISYVFFPLSSILRRNDLSAIPDRLLEKLFSVLCLLVDAWWWDMDVTVWEQIFMLTSAIVGGIDRKGKGRDRDDETKAAAVGCLRALLRERAQDENPVHHHIPDDRVHLNLTKFRSHTQTQRFLPLMGQTLDSLMISAESPHLPLQRVSLNVLSIIMETYLPDGFVPSILPGTMSSMCKVALATGSARGWANGDIVAASLLVAQYAVIRSISNEICIQEGVIKNVDNLEDLVGDEPQEKPNTDEPSPIPYSTLRTESWLRGTASQLHIALNGLSPLVKHQTPAALIGLSSFSAAILTATALTVPQSQPLLLSFLLALQTSSFDSVSSQAESSLRHILTSTGSSRHHILQALLQISRDNLAALPRLILTHADSKVEYAAGIIQSVCRLAMSPDCSSPHPGIAAISAGVGKLLGPHGGIEKWGWSLLSTLEFTSPPVVVTETSTAQLMLERDPTAMDTVPFPELTFLRLSSRSSHEALASMFRALGTTAGEACLFAAEWFMDVGQSGRGKRAVAALWCACRLLEGAAKISLNSVTPSSISARPPKRLEKLARDLARRIAETWDTWDDEQVVQDAEPRANADDENTMIEHVRGLVTVRSIPGTGGDPSSTPTRHHSTVQPLLHRALSLQLLSITAGILESRFLPLLLHVLYPVLHGIVSENSLISASALAALNFITNSTSYATPANLLLSNFDYALDSVSRRLSRRWLDVDATKVLAVLVRLVGRDVVQKAGDVVEECFDRLDEYHGYELIVDGLVEVLGEVVHVIGDDEDNRLPQEARATYKAPSRDDEEAHRLDSFADWFLHRHDKLPPEEVEEDEPDMPSSPPDREDAGGGDASRGQDPAGRTDNPFPDPPPTPTQALTTQIVSRSIYFLTHRSPIVRARILLLLSRAVPVLPEAALLPSVHHAWPFVLNRLADPETFVVSAAAALVAALATHVGDFMYRRVWDDVWPRFREMLRRLERADATSALARRATPADATAGTQSAYTHSHRLYRAIITTVTAAARGVRANDATSWEVVVLFRRFLRSEANEELQAAARELYIALCENNEDAVWLGLEATLGLVEGPVGFLREPKWDIERNVTMILSR